MRDIKQLKAFLEADGYWKHLGMKVRSLQKGYAELSLKLREELTHSYGSMMHGGAMASLLDASVFVSMILLMDFERERTTTIELKINYLKPVRFSDEREIVSCARVVKKGKSVAVGTCEIKDGEELIAMGIATYAILQQE